MQTDTIISPKQTVPSEVERRGTPAPAPAQPLFRPEVMVEHQSQWLGTVLLEPRITHWMFASLALVATAAVLGLLFFTSYTRKARINGWLVPQQGLVRVFAPQGGVITQVHVKEGTEVRKGAPLLAISTEMQSLTVGATRQEVVDRLTKRRNSMAEEKTVQERLFSQQAADLMRRIAALEDEQKYLAQEMDLQRSRIQLSERVAKRMRAMRAKDIVPEPRLEEAERERIQENAKLQGLERTQAALQREHLQLTASLREIPLRRLTQLAEIERNVALLEQELAEAEERREIVILAPQDGTVTGMQVESGGSAQPSVPLMNIVPAGATLQAQLFSPSRAVGFLREGQRVHLRYEAFPYQKFGFHQGVVVSVSRSAMSPAEMTQQLSGLTTLYGTNEPVYRVTVDLSQQNVTAYGKSMPLQPGMQLEADVLLESRRLVEWMLEPLFSISGKWAG
ncbi:HlyD family efflux transporter periplasmic adaptor subunit [Microvirga lenta]|uniref:HlyD family efflux transporter periplasmic adaptor subunit n=1 Tax=Microvirga lenta TaxID=2881337 RepID=UPI001CFE813B|nr:HlyD family efflux transporter periplasmic adaptor subunit [Microvirga lenta]MCB5174200.1 HlyD family efflux transporter periplasmic adaptor subunit [Microvirga lenta]